MASKKKLGSLDGFNYHVIFWVKENENPQRVDVGLIAKSKNQTIVDDFVFEQSAEGLPEVKFKNGMVVVRLTNDDLANKQRNFYYQCFKLDKQDGHFIESAQCPRPTFIGL
jgi:hypothetical protein